MEEEEEKEEKEKALLNSVRLPRKKRKVVTYLSQHPCVLTTPGEWRTPQSLRSSRSLEATSASSIRRPPRSWAGSASIRRRRPSRRPRNRSGGSSCRRTAPRWQPRRRRRRRPAARSPGTRGCSCQRRRTCVDSTVSCTIKKCLLYSEDCDH